jgi:AraC-like DNA-binding protein
MPDRPDTADPLADIITLLQPRAVVSKAISGAGAWAVRYSAFGQPGFCVILEGGCRLSVEGQPPVDLLTGDFVLLPATPAFTMSSFEKALPQHIDPRAAAGRSDEVRHGRQDGPPDVRLLGGHFSLSSANARLAVSLLPAMIHIRDNPRLALLIRLVCEEANQPARASQLVLARLVEVLLVEALRAGEDYSSRPGLMRGLADQRVSEALKAIHAAPERTWTIHECARTAGMSRSAFFERFARLVGMSPMEYVLSWRMALAKELLRAKTAKLDEVARRVGYGSGSTFSIAFSRHVGMAPGRYARNHRWSEPS